MMTLSSASATTTLSLSQRRDKHWTNTKLLLTHTHINQMFKSYLKKTNFDQTISNRHHDRVLDIGPVVGSNGNAWVGFIQNFFFLSIYFFSLSHYEACNSLDKKLQNKINIKIGLEYPHLIKETATHGMDRKMMIIRKQRRWEAGIARDGSQSTIIRCFLCTLRLLMDFTKSRWVSIANIMNMIPMMEKTYEGGCLSPEHRWLSVNRT